ncbi:RNA-binding domain superfamily [Arabidopsis suecica]|uniref:RNA-binding domain superfamily n=1 Tax=Arabidopsis suecica TaxID=45249 RepID=A0A8T2FJT2_ARASU|nr:RNA-binding domain superfamily [Arabidopsis suecica]
MEEPREESEAVRDCSEPMEEAGKGSGLSSKTETLVDEDANTDLGVSDKNPNDGGLATVDVDDDDDVKRTDAVTEIECEGDTGTVEVKLNDETAKSEVKSKSGATHETAGEEETENSVANEATDEKATCEVEDNGGVCDAEQDVETENFQLNPVHGETLSVAEDKADQEKETTKKIEKDINEMEVDSKQEDEENETEDAKHSESAQVPEESTKLSKEETDEENQKEENGVAMEIDGVAGEHVEKVVKVGSGSDNACNESAGASMVQTQDVPIAEADNNESNVVKKMEIDERKDNADMTSDLTGTIESADSAIPNSPTEDAAPGEVEPLDHNALFDPTSDITNFIDFSGVSSWSGNIQDLKTETGNVSLKEDKKVTDMAEDVVTADIETESNEARVGVGAESPAAATDCSKETSDATLGSEENQQDKDHQCLDKKTADVQDTMIEEDDITHEAPSFDPNQKENAEMEENHNNFVYADDEAGSDVKTNGVKRKADVLSEDSPGEGRKTVSFAKVSFAERPSFKIGACIARAASQMAGSPSVLKGSNFGDETLSVESFVSQLHCAATDPVKENVVSDIATGFFLDFRNSSASQQVTTEKVSKKRGRPSNSNVAGTEAFEFEEMGDTYWTDRVIHNGGEGQTPATEKGSYQVVPVELKPAQVQRTRRPYRRRQSQISIPHSATKKPADIDENAPAEIIMNFFETDTIPPEKSLSKMFRHFGPIQELRTEVDREKNRARVVFRKGADAEVAYNSAGRFNIFGTKVVKYELSRNVTETFKVQPYVVSLAEEDAAVCPSS